MAVPGLFVEYLVSGAVALFWLYPLIRDALGEIPPALLPLLALGLYVVGMAIDFAAWLITRPAKHRIRAWLDRKYAVDGAAERSGTYRQAKIALHSPELAKELAMRSSRDRIARGAIVNALLATVLVLPVWGGAALTAASVLLWAGFEKLSYSFELCAERAIDDRLSGQSA